ncbi:MAG: hypothetical protein KGQ61_02955 [Planctomycetes bacterium]|nr:hypothetical protein [Planctomycetota bacterium]
MARVSLKTVSCSAVFACLLAAPANAGVLDLPTPSGLSPGDHFRFIFVTGSNTTPTSSDVNTYDTFVRNSVSSLYGTVTYGGSAITNWAAVVSTPTVSAKDHLGGYSSTVSVWLTGTAGGPQVASSLTTSTGGLWSNLLLGGNTVSRKLDGSSTSYTNVWTGSAADGTALLPMGSSPNVTIGHTYVGGAWLYTNPPGSAVNTASYPLFAVSPELVVPGGAVPEIDPAATVSVLTLVTSALGLLERRRSGRQ